MAKWTAEYDKYIWKTFEADSEEDADKIAADKRPRGYMLAKVEIIMAKDEKWAREEAEKIYASKIVQDAMQKISDLFPDYAGRAELLPRFHDLAPPIKHVAPLVGGLSLIPQNMG